MTIPPLLKSEAPALTRIALPLMAAYLAELGMFITTKVVVSELGYHELAAVGIATDLSFEIMIVSMGLLSIVGVLCAQAEGAGEKRQTGVAVRQGLIICVLIGIPATAAVWHLDKVLAWSGQEPIVVEIAKPYLAALSGFVLPVLFFSVLRSFVSALSQANIVMWIALTAVFLNYLLASWLVHGGLWLAPMGVQGAGIATTLVSWLMLGGLVCYVYRTPSLRGYGVFGGRWRFDAAVCREIMMLGIPIAGIVFLEAGLFVAVSIFSGIISAETLAAYEMVMAWVGIPFVVALGIAEATMIRVANGLGRNQPSIARQSGFLGMCIGVGVLLVMIIVPLGFASVIINVFISPADPGAAVVSLMAAEFLAIAALFQVFDGLQAIAAHALRGMKDSVVPLWIASFGYWVLGIGGGALLAFHFELGGVGLWWGMALGLTVTGSLLAWRFHIRSATPLGHSPWRASLKNKT